MSSERFAHVLQHLRTRLGPVGAESTTDAQLLTRFVQFAREHGDSFLFAV